MLIDLLLNYELNEHASVFSNDIESMNGNAVDVYKRSTKMTLNPMNTEKKRRIFHSIGLVEIQNSYEIKNPRETDKM